MSAALFQTLADPTRLRILESLKDGEKTVTNIVDLMEIKQSGVSRHLSILEDAGFVQMRPDGQRRLYSIRPEPFTEIADWVHTYQKFWNQKLDKLENHFKKRNR